MGEYRIHKSGNTQVSEYTSWRIHKLAYTQVGVYTSRRIHKSAYSQVMLGRTRLTRTQFIAFVGGPKVPLETRIIALSKDVPPVFGS